jgi:rubrerythrin
VPLRHWTTGFRKRTICATTFPPAAKKEASMTNIAINPTARLVGIDPKADLRILQTSLAFEHEGIAAYRLAGASGLLAPDTLSVALMFKGHHEQHRDALAELIRQAGATPIEALADVEYVRTLELSKLKSQGDVIALATRLERAAAAGYAGQVEALHDRRLAQLFADICADETIHWTVLNGAAGGKIPETAFVFA